MKMNVYTIYDSASEAYSRPFFAEADGAAVRQFGDIANDAEHCVGLHPEHYSLYRTGTFCQQTGKLNEEPVTHLANAHELYTSERAPKPPMQSVQ